MKMVVYDSDPDPVKERPVNYKGSLLRSEQGTSNTAAKSTNNDKNNDTGKMH